MNPAEHALLAHVRTLDRVGGNLRRRGFVYRNHYDFLVREGAFFEPGPADCSLAPRLCFFNALVLAAVRRLPYVEGMAVSVHGGRPVHHAWNLNPDGTVADATWRSGRGYLGVQFSAERANTATWDLDASVLQDPTFTVLRTDWIPEPSPGRVTGLVEKMARDAIADPDLGPKLAHDYAVTTPEELVDVYRRMAA